MVRTADAFNKSYIHTSFWSQSMRRGVKFVNNIVKLNECSQALKTSKDAKNPVFVSVGHKISLKTAKEVVLRCCKYRVPEPIRFADYSSREIIRKSSSQTRSRKE